MRGVAAWKRTWVCWGRAACRGCCAACAACRTAQAPLPPLPPPTQYFALIIRAIGVLEGIALVGNPEFAIVDEVRHSCGFLSWAPGQGGVVR